LLRDEPDPSSHVAAIFMAFLLIFYFDIS